MARAASRRPGMVVEHARMVLALLTDRSRGGQFQQASFSHEQRLSMRLEERARYELPARKRLHVSSVSSSP